MVLPTLQALFNPYRASVLTSSGYISKYINLNQFQMILIVMFTILFLIFIGMLIFFTIIKEPEQWPPNIGNCPDYWIDTSGNGANCVNVKYLGICQGIQKKTNFFQEDPDISKENNDAETMNFSVYPYIGSSGKCAKYTWAKLCQLSWNGITYGYGDTNPCI
jgi:hypothetical protein